MYRVLKPGGRLVVCEFSKPPRALFRTGYAAYMRFVMPVVAAVASSNEDAYGYLRESIEEWPDQGTLTPVDPRRRIHAGRLPQPDRRRRGAAPRPQARGRRDPGLDRPAPAETKLVNRAPPLARRSNTLSSSLGLGEKLFASSEERQFAAAIEKGLDEVEAGLLARDDLRRRRRRRHHPLPARGRRQARAPDADPAHRAAGHGQQPRRHHRGRGRRDHPPRLAVPRRRDG